MSDLEDTVSLSPGPEPIRHNRPDFIEIGTSFNAIEIDSVLRSIAETNELGITWQLLQQILDALISKQCKIMEEKVIDEAIKKEIDELSMKIIHSIHDHTNCPFTIQRLCELLIEPTKYYTMYIKYLRAVEKVLAVTSYWMDYAIKDESMETINASSAEGLFPQTIDYIELERHNFDIGNEESNKDQEEAEEKNNTVETKQVEADDKQVEKESALTKEVEEDEKNDVASASTAVETQPNTEQMDVELKSNEEKQVDKQVEKQEVKMDLD